MAARAAQRRPSRAAGDPVVRSASRPRREPAPITRARGGAAALPPSWRLRLIAATPIAAPGGGRNVGAPPSRVPGKSGNRAPSLRPGGPAARPERAGSRWLRIDRNPIGPPPPRGVASGRGALRAAPAPAEPARRRRPAPLCAALPARPGGGLAGLVAASRVPPAEQVPRLLRRAPPLTRRQRAAPAAGPGAAIAAAPPQTRTPAGPAPAPLRPAAATGAPPLSARPARRSRPLLDARRTGESPAAGTPLPPRGRRSAASRAAFPRGRTTPAPAMAPRLRPPPSAATEAKPEWPRRLRPAAVPAPPLAASPAARRLSPVRGVRAARAAAGLAAPWAEPTPMRDAPMSPPPRRPAAVVGYGRMPSPADAALRPLPPLPATRRPKRALSPALQPAGRDPAAAGAHALPRPRRARQAAQGERGHGAQPITAQRAGEAARSVQRAWRTPATIARAVRTAATPGLTAAAPARAPGRSGARRRPLALRPNDAPPAVATAWRSPGRSAMRFESSPPAAAAPPGPSGTAKRRRQAPASPGRLQLRDIDAIAGFQPVPPARPRRTAIGLTAARRPIVEPVVLPGPPLRRARKVPSAPRFEAPVLETALTPAGRRRGRPPPAHLPPSPIPRPARRSSSTAPAAIERTAFAAPGRSLRLVHAERPAAAAERRARRSTELLWASRPVSASAMFRESGAQQPAAAAAQAQSLAAEAPPPNSLPQPAPPDMNRLVDEVLHRLQRQARTERQRRGI